MLTREENDLLTQTGPGTPGGELLRRYWQPVALSEELQEDVPRSVRVLSEDLTLFRDDKGQPGLIGAYCPHRGTDLSYGRVEDGGIRCVYHGWLFDREGCCREMPGEPAGSEFPKKIKQPAYPCQENGGFIFAYLGPGEPTLLPQYEALAAPYERRQGLKYLQECNYLQGNEGNIDPAHVSFVHRMNPGYALNAGRRYKVPGAIATLDFLAGEDVAPQIEVEETDFGMRIFAIRGIGEGRRYVRITNFIMPNLAAFPGPTGSFGYSMHWHVPIDDERHWKYMINFSRTKPIEKEKLLHSSLGGLTEDYRLLRNLSNRYRQDREEMRTQTFTGMGPHFAVHDAMAIETAGPTPIRDRTVENLGYSDKAIIQARRMLLRGIQQVEEGKEPPHVLRDPAAAEVPNLVVLSEAISSSEDWRTFWRDRTSAKERV